MPRRNSGPTSGDLILDFSRSGYNDLEVDLGSLGSLQSEAVAAGGTVQLNAYNVSSQLLNDFGSVNGLSFTVVNRYLNNVAWVTQTQTSSSGPNPAPNDLSGGTAHTLAGNILGVSTAITTWSGQNPASSSGNTANVASIPSSAALGAAYVDSYTHLASEISSYAHNSANTAPGNFSSGDIVSDLFQYSGLGVNTPSVFEGDFTFNSDGTLDFSVPAVAAPEPGAYGALAGGGLLLLSLGRQFRKQQA